MDDNCQGHLNTEAHLEKHSVSPAKFFIIKHFTDNGEHVYGGNPICVYGCAHV